MKLGIDASNIGIGGGITHLKELLTHLILENSFEIINVYASQNVLNQIQDSIKIKKISFPEFNKSLYHRVRFQIWGYDKHIKRNCDILFSITGDYLGNFKPVVGMSRNMLLYERDIWKKIHQPLELIRFWINFRKQKRCFKNATGIIFISRYAKNYVSKVLNLKEKEISVIYHGISPRFHEDVKIQISIDQYSYKNPFKLIYVSTVHVYKNQWNVVEAVYHLRQKGYPLELNLVGGVIYSPAGKKLQQVIKEYDPKNEFVHYHGHIPYDEIDKLYKNSDGIIYASTCENMPNILIESMASGISIACSNKQPMPEFLKENGFYFDANDVESIVNSIEEMLLKPEVREAMAKRNVEVAKKYSWEETAIQTYQFIQKIYNQYYNV